MTERTITAYPTVKLIISEHLKAKGLDGLANVDRDFDGCGCTLDDLMPCIGSEMAANVPTCLPAHKVECPGASCVLGHNCGAWHLVPGPKPGSAAERWKATQ